MIVEAFFRREHQAHQSRKTRKCAPAMFALRSNLMHRSQPMLAFKRCLPTPITKVVEQRRAMAQNHGIAMATSVLLAAHVTPNSAVSTGIFDIIPEGQGTRIRELFRESVEARTIANHTLRRFIRSVNPNEYQRAIDAIEGCKDGGLRIDAESNEVFLALLLRAGQLRLAIETYQEMLSRRVVPHTNSYNQLVRLCIERQSWDGALTLYEEMMKRGRKPDVTTYELVMQAYALQSPTQWEKAVAVFDKLQGSQKGMSSTTYNSLMQVYLKMEPFDWRVVYNCYYEMRYARPKIHFGWHSHALVDEAMRRGGAGRWRRFTCFIDAWVQITPFFSPQYWAGAAVFCSTLMLLRALVGTLTVWGASPRKDIGGESQLDSTTRNISG